jgi:outer membrane lipoprotein-sorting protein
MLKILLVIAAFLAGSAHAGQWTTIAVAAGGGRLQADLESVTIDKYSKTSDGEGMVTTVVMRYLDKEPTASFLVAVDVEECLTREGGTVVIALPDNSTKTYQWSPDSKMMYDAQGQFLCGYTREKHRQIKGVAGKKISI